VLPAVHVRRPEYEVRGQKAKAPSFPSGDDDDMEKVLPRDRLTFVCKRFTIRQLLQLVDHETSIDLCW
jgi:hypothetical protein